MKPWERFQQQPQQSSGKPWERFQSAQTATQGSSPSLPEFGTVDGNSALFGDGQGFLDGNLGGDVTSFGSLLKDGLAQTFTLDPKARVDGIEQRFPQLQVTRTENGQNALVTNPETGKQAIVNKDGFSAQDFAQLSGGAISFLPAGKAIGAARGIGGKAATAGLGSAATDIALQGIEKAQGSEQEFNPTRTALTGALGFGLQGAGSKAAQSLDDGAARSLLNKAAPAIDELKDRASQLYQQVDKLGVSLKPESFQGIINKLEKVANNFGFTPEIQKNTAAALNALGQREGQSPSFSDLNNFRKILGSAAQSNERADSALASKLIQTFDETLDNLPKLSINGDPAKASQASGLLKQARTEFAKSKKSELLQTAITNGQNAASGAENGVRGKFRSLLERINSGKVKGFSDQEKQQIQNVVDGKGANLAKLIGKGAFDPNANNFVGGSIGTAAAGAAGGVPAIIAQQVVSGGAKKVAERATLNNANTAVALSRAGSNGLEIARAYIKLVPKNQRTAEGLAEILRTQGANADDLLRRAQKMGGENKETVINAAKLLLSEEAVN